MVNEIWPLLRVLWLALGPYELDLKFDPIYDTQELGAFNLPRINSYYKARYQFKIDSNGAWTADFEHDIFIHGHDHPPIEFGKEFTLYFRGQVTEIGHACPYFTVATFPRLAEWYNGI